MFIPPQSPHDQGASGPTRAEDARSVRALLDRYWSGQSNLDEESQLAEWARAATRPQSAPASAWPEDLQQELAALHHVFAAQADLGRQTLSDGFDARFWAAAKAADAAVDPAAPVDSAAPRLNHTEARGGVVRSLQTGAHSTGPAGSAGTSHQATGSGTFRQTTGSGTSFRLWMGRAAVLLVAAATAFAVLRPGTLEGLMPGGEPQTQGQGTVLAYAEAGQEAEALEQTMAALLLMGEKLNVANRQTARIGVINTAMESYASPTALVRKAIANNTAPKTSAAPR